MVTAKFKVSRVSPMGADTIEEAWATEVEMTPDYVGGANKEWSEATPAGVCRLTITNKAALKHLQLGESLTVYFAQEGEEVG